MSEKQKDAARRNVVAARAAKLAKQPSLEDRFWSKVDRRGPGECWPWTAAVRRKDEGYGAFWYEGRHHPAPRMALVLTGVEVPAGMVACHRCDNPSCCNPGHLFVGTPQDNDADRVAKKRQAYGARNANARLDDQKVWMMRRLRAIGATYSHIASFFGVTAYCVFDACHRRWQHVDMEAQRQHFLKTNWWRNRDTTK